MTHEEATADSVFRAIADPTRRQILTRLIEEPCSVEALCEPFDVSQPAISQHLKVLREADLVSARTEWRNRIYHVTPHRLREVADWLRPFERFWDRALDRLATAVEDSGETDA